MKRFTSMLLILCLTGFVIGCGDSTETGTDESKTGEALQSDPDYEKQMMGGGDAAPEENK